MDLARRTHVGKKPEQKAQHPFVQAPHGAQHPTSDTREICVCHSLHSKRMWPGWSTRHCSPMWLCVCL